MKRKAALLLAVSMLFAGAVSAAGAWGTYKGNNIIRLTINGEAAKVSDVPVISYQGRTMVPIYLLQQAGVEYTWDQRSQTVDVVKQDNANELREGAVLWMQLYAMLLDVHRDLDDFGESLANVYNGQQAVLRSIQNGDEDAGKRLQDERAFLDELQSYYVYMAERARSNDQWSEENGYPTSIETVLLNYEEALALYEKAYESLGLYLEFGEQADADDFDTFSNDAVGDIQEVRDIAFEGYQEFYGYMQDFK